MSNDVVVEVQGITKRFGDVPIFNDVSLRVHKGEVVAIIGPSGAGKSSLIRCINQLITFESGSINVLGHVLHGTDEKKPALSHQEMQEIRAKVGMVFQNFNLFPHLTVMDNITLAPTRTLRHSKESARVRAQDLLTSVGLASKAECYPHRLSGGEQQRVAICRALAMEPEVMLFVEPTSALDPELVGEVLDAIQVLARAGMTMILVTHEMSFAAEVADTVIVMADGGIAEDGDARRVLTSPSSERVRAFLRRELRHSSLTTSLSDEDESPQRATPKGQEDESTESREGMPRP